MNLILLNEAEAVIEPFWDGGTSDPNDPDPRFRSLGDYRVETAPGALARAEQGWAFVFLTVDRTVPGAPVLKLHRTCSLDVSDYDTFLLSGNFPKCFSVSLSVLLDGREVPLFRGVNGTGTANEYSAGFRGRMLSAITLEIRSGQSGVQGELSWFGLANGSRLAQMLERKSRYDPSWPGYFTQPAGDIVPDIGILFDGDELRQLRKKLSAPPFREIYAVKKKQAEADMALVPENYIGRYVPYFDLRWNRTRDRAWVGAHKSGYGMHIVMENLAFVGIVENDPEMLRMAARHAIAAAHCEYWFESPMDNLPGATWHHRSFTENFFCRSVSLVLDWCGSLLTPFAKQVLRDALALKGLPRLESDFKRVEYIRHINQGIVFSEGRVLALLALLPRHPRYRSNLEEAERDVIEMVHNYENADGGTPEGPGYWMYTFGEVSGTIYALARYHHKPFTAYRELFQRTGDFALSLLSMEDEGTALEPISDTHPDAHVSCALAGSFYQFTGKPEWKTLYCKLLRMHRVDSDTFSLISAPLPDETELPPQGFPLIYPVTGQAAVWRQGAEACTHLRLCTGPICITHYHEDRGSILLEADGETLCPDCGAAEYSESELLFLSFPQSHSLLNPVFAGGALARQGQREKGGELTFSQVRGDGAELISDNTAAWSGRPYASVRRRVISPFAELLILEDAFALDRADSVEFLLNSFASWRWNGQEAQADFAHLRLRLRPLNWEPEAPDFRRFQDGIHRPVWQIGLPYGKARAAKLLTALSVEKSLPIGLSLRDDSLEVSRGGQRWKILLNRPAD
jgi:hypothetical protein